MNDRDLRQAVSELPVGVEICRADGGIVFYNRCAVRLWGQEPDLKADRYFGAKRLWRTDGLPLPVSASPIAESLRDGKPRRDRAFMIERPDGSRLPVRVDVVPISLDEEEGICVLITISESPFQPELERDYAMLAAIFEHSEDAIFCISLDHRIISWNRAAERIFGYSPEEAVGESVLRLSPPERHELEKAVFERLVAGESLRHYDSLAVRKDGSRIFTSVSVSPLRNRAGSIVGISIICRDISDRILAESSLKGWQNLVSLALAAGRMVAWRRDFVKERWRRTDGSREVIEGSAAEFYARVHPEDLPLIDEALHRAIEDKTEYTSDFRMLQEDGSYRWFASRARIHFDSDGRPKAMTGVSVDITEQKRIEEELREAQERLSRLNEELEHRVRERTARLADTVAELETFSYSIAHDMRGPLRTMAGFAQVLETEYSQNLPSLARSYLERISNSAQRLDRLIHEVLSYGRILLGNIPISRVDLEPLIYEILDSYPMLRGNQKSVTIESPLLPVRGNVGSLTQVVSNLLENAFKSIAPGVDPRIRIWAEEKESCVRVWIEDNGIGIEEELRRNVFDLFQHLHPEAPQEGTGAALAIVRKAVQRMGGRVGVESNVGEGSRFWFELPRGGS